ncbi:MAG: hypothetical protein N4A35_06640 [Flavobacteriales bacterium]|jgi:hypothetical protein|nr:hypothetical protein [Flavobacteriales bacterium]
MILFLIKILIVPVGYYSVLFYLRENKYSKYVLFKNDVNESFFRLILREKKQDKNAEPSKSGPAEINPIKTEKEINKEKGDLFEKQIVELLNIKKDTRLEFLEWRGDKYHEGAYPNSNKAPDLHISYTDNDTKECTETLIECKYRSRFKNGKLDLNKYIIDSKTKETIVFHKIKEYKDYADKIGVSAFLFLGVGDCPSKTKDIYLIPMNVLDDRGFVYENHISKYKRDYPHHKMKFNRSDKKYF